MHKAIPPLPNMPSWDGAQFKKSTGTTLPFTLFNDALSASDFIKH